MATTLISKVRAITKSTVAIGVTDDSVLDALTAGCHFIMATAPKELLHSYAEAVTVNDANGFSYNNDTVLVVERNGSVATPLPPELYYSATVSGASSLYARTKLFPGFYPLRGKLYIKPDPTVAEPATITCVKVPTIISGTVSVFGMLEEGVVQYACAVGLSSLANIWRDKAIVELEAITSSGYLVDFENAVPTFTKVPSPSLSSIPTIGSLPSVPTSPALPSFPADLSLPSVPSVPNIPVFPEAISLPTVPVENPLPSSPSTTLSAPSFTYTKPVGSADFTTLDAQIASDDTEVGQLVASKIANQLNELRVKIENEQAVLNQQAEEYKSGVAQFGSEWQAYQQEASSLLQEFSSRVQNYSAEAQSTLTNYSSNIQKASAQTQAVLNKYSSEVQAYSAQASTEIKDYDSRVGKISSDAQIKLADFGEKIKVYIAEVSSVIQTYSTSIQAYAAENGAVLQKYSNDVQSNVADFQSGLAKAMAYLSEAGVRLQTMAQYSALSADSTNKANGHYLLAYRFAETHITKFVGAQNASA